MKKQSLTAAALSVAILAGDVQAEGWDYRVVPYFWAPTFETSLDIGANPPVDQRASIFDILKGAFLIAGEARKGPWSIGGEFNYLDLGNQVSFRRFNNFARWDMDGTMISIGGGYTFYDQGRNRVEVLAAARNWNLNLSTTVGRFRVSETVNWTDPLVGGRYSRQINDRLRFTGMANVGGFDVGSRFQWEALFEFNWDLSERIDVAGGYRHLSLEFEDSRRAIDLILTGPYVALAFKF